MLFVDRTAPLRLPLLDNTLELLAHYNDLYHWIDALRIRFNDATFSFKAIASPRFFLTSDPVVLEAVLKSDFDAFEKGPLFRHNTGQLLGDGIFNVDGHQWIRQRKTAANIFNVRNFRDYFSSVFRNESNLLVSVLSRYATEGSVVDLHDIFHRYTLESFSTIAFGLDVPALSSLLHGNADPIEFATAFDEAQRIVDRRFFNPFWWWLEYLDGTRARYERCVRTMDAFAHRVIQARRVDPNKDTYADLLSLFMNAKEKYSDHQLRDIVMNLIIAGRDTTAQALAWTFFELHRNPDVLSQLRTEFDSVLGPHATPDDFSYDSLKDLPFASAVFSETLRLHPSVPKQAKMAVRNVMLPDGTHVPKGSWLAWSSWSMGRSTALWGPDACEYRPERFIMDGKQPSAFKFIAFNAGPRLCLGKTMAYLETIMAMWMVTREFDVEVVDEKEVMYQNALTLSMRNGLRCRLKKRTL